MTNLIKRYRHTSYDDGMPAFVDPDGEWVKFADIAELLKPASNSEMDDICPLCKQKCFPSKYYCADCNNEFYPS